MSRLKLPAYGKALLDQRDRGVHPKAIHVLYAKFWNSRPATENPWLCVDLDYTHGVYDWSIVSGIPVHIWWRDGEQIQSLAAEVAQHSPSVFLITPRGQQMSVIHFFQAHESHPRHPLWSVDDEKDYLERESEYHQALLADLHKEMQPHGGSD